MVFFWKPIYNSNYIMRKPTIISCVASAILFFLLIGTNPTQLPSWLLIVPFILLFSAIWSISFSNFRSHGLSRLRSVRLSLVLAGLPVSLLLLQSIGQLTARDIMTILAFFALAYFYISRIVTD